MPSVKDDITATQSTTVAHQSSYICQRHRYLERIAAYACCPIEKVLDGSGKYDSRVYLKEPSSRETSVVFRILYLVLKFCQSTDVRGESDRSPARNGIHHADSQDHCGLRCVARCVSAFGDESTPSPSENDKASIRRSSPRSTTDGWRTLAGSTSLIKVNRFYWHPIQTIAFRSRSVNQPKDKVYVLWTGDSMRSFVRSR